MTSVIRRIDPAKGIFNNAASYPEGSIGQTLKDGKTSTDPAKGSALYGHRTQNGIASSVRAALNVSEPKNPVSGALQFEYSNDPMALNYGSSRAVGAIQHRDSANAAANEIIPGVVDQFIYSGNGVVNPVTELSESIWQGRFAFTRKTGDGSAHCFTGIGELGVYGPGMYNELGLFQAEGTNTGSQKGTMSGGEILLKDSPDGGTSTYSTKMQGWVSRIAKYNPTIRKSHSFFASSEGSLPIDAILGGNPGGLASWLRGFDFQGLKFTTGQFGLAPNNTFLGWLTLAGAAKSVLGVNNTDNVFLAATAAGKSVNITDATFATKLLIDDNATDAVALVVMGVLRRISAGAIDSAGAGFRALRVQN